MRDSGIRSSLPALLALVLSACGGGGGGDDDDGPAPFVTGSGFNGQVTTVALAADGSGDIYVGGGFSEYNGVASDRIVRLNADGSIDAGFDVGTGFNAFVFIVAPATDGSGDVYVGGSFTAYNGVAVGQIVRLNADGSIDPAFDTGTGLDDLVFVIVPAPDGSGDIFVGGAFTVYDGAGNNRLIKLQADGSLAPGFDVGSGFNDTVLTIAPALDGSGDIYAGGFFTIYRGNARNRIARVNGDGSNDGAFMPGTGFDDLVASVVAIPDGSGDIYAGGRFTLYQGASRNRIARLDPSGALDAGFAVGAGFEGAGLTGNIFVDTIALTGSGGRLYAAGRFSSYDGTQAIRIARLNTDGSLDPGFIGASGFGPAAANPFVDIVVMLDDGSGRFYAGGTFDTYRGAVSNRIVRINANGTRN